MKNIGSLLKSLFYFYFENPFKTWWKVRKVFKFPMPKFGFGFSKYGFVDPYWGGRILYVETMDVDWKTKYDMFRFIDSPMISIILFRHIKFLIQFRFGDSDLEVWETILCYLYDDKIKGNLALCIEENTWSGNNTKTGETKYYDARPYIRKKVLLKNGIEVPETV